MPWPRVTETFKQAPNFRLTVESFITENDTIIARWAADSTLRQRYTGRIFKWFSFNKT